MNEIIVTSPVFTESIKSFLHSGGSENQTTHTFIVGQNTICDILIVGGGGAGGDAAGGGGGAGGVVYTINQILKAGVYTIGVGKGGEGNRTNNKQDGKDSYIQFNNTDVTMNMNGVKQNLRGYGGGGGGTFTVNNYFNLDTLNILNGRNGGSGGGCSEDGRSSETTDLRYIIKTGINTQGNTFWNGITYIPGGKTGRKNIAGVDQYQGAGGGGIGEVNSDYRSGSDGISINISGSNVIYAAGGGAGQDIIRCSTCNIYGIGGSKISGRNSIGGSGYILGTNTSPTAGVNGTGSGGGGGGSIGANGGSGIVIIKFKSIVNASISEGNPITHKILNFVYDNNLLKYDFSPYNTEATWKAYAATIPNFTYSLDSFLTSFDSDAVWAANNAIGWFQMTLPSTHNFLTITHGLGVQGTGDVRLLINGVLKSTATPSNRLITYSQVYNAGDILRVEEEFSTMTANIIIELTNTNNNTYNISIQPGTKLQINNRNVEYLKGNYIVDVGPINSSITTNYTYLINGQNIVKYDLSGSSIEIKYSEDKDCSGNWNIWSDCSANTGIRSRTYRILNDAKTGGVPCPSQLLESDNCNVDCSGNWNTWTDCSANTGTRSRTYRIIYDTKNNGLACPSQLLESDNCNIDCSGNWNTWSDCSANTGTRSRTYRIIYDTKNNGLACPSQLLESDNCNIDCSGNWTAWSDCSANTGTMSRKYTIFNQHKNNGLACPSQLLESNNCNVDCSGNWSDWSACTADTVTSTRTYRIINLAKNNGVPCPSQLLESKKCETKNILSVIVNFFKLILSFILNLFKI